MNIFCLDADQVARLWPEYRHHLERYERECGTDYALDLLSDLKAGRKQLWGLQDDAGDVAGVVLTRVAECPNGPVCEIYAACGNAHGRTNECLEAIELWAKSINCKRIRLQGRNGWLRVLKEYEQSGIILEKSLL